MTSTMFTSGGTGESIRFAVGKCSLGSILVAATEQGVCAILLGDDADALLHDLQGRFPVAQLIGGGQDFEGGAAQVAGFFEAPSLGLTLPLEVRGSAFWQRVWQALRGNPAGATAGYAGVARRLG